MAKKYPAHHAKIKASVEKDVTIEIEDAFANAFDEIIGDVLDQYSDKVDAGDIADTLDLDSYNTIATGIQKELEAVHAEAATESITQVSVHIDNYAAKAADMFDRANDDAKQYSINRAAELIGKKWNKAGWPTEAEARNLPHNWEHDRLDDDPNAVWAIDDTTRSGVADLITSAYENGSTPTELSKSIETSYNFSKARASMIARTELSRASMQGNLSGWKISGVVDGKEWILSDDHDFDDECNDNDDAGVIPIDDDFPSGDDAPPAHPSCDCSMATNVLDDTEDE